jgi:excisionase family DNA binding protein
MPKNAPDGVAVPSQAETALARETKRFLTKHTGTQSPIALRLLNPSKGAGVRIPPAAVRLLLRILDEMSQGHAVKLIPIRPELTTQETADLLNISRPTLIQLLNEGEIEFRKVGSHRRIRLESAAKYKRKMDSERLKALAELSAYDQQLGL